MKYAFDAMYTKFTKEEEKAILDFYAKYKKHLKEMPAEDIYSLGLLNYAAEVFMKEKDLEKTKLSLTKGYLVNKMPIIPAITPEIRKFFGLKEKNKSK